MKNFIFKISVLLIFCFPQISCETKSKKIENKKIVITNNNDLIFKKNLNDKPKLFLKFWSNMSKNDFYKVVEILVKDKTMVNQSFINLYYIVNDNCKVQLNPIFENQTLKEIELSNITCLYPLYGEKYNLPPLKKKNYTDFAYLENNPEYSPIMSYEKNNETINLPDAFYDRNSFLPKGETIPLKPIGMTESMLFESPIIVDKGNVIMIFDQEIIKSEGDFNRYSLEDSKEILNYQATAKGFQGLGLFGDEHKYLITNSKLRTVSVNSSVLIKVTYKSIDDYKTEIEKEEKLKNYNLKQNKENLKRQNSARNDI